MGEVLRARAGGAWGPKLGPIVWQFAPTKKFDPEDFGGFLKLLPDTLQGLSLRHALEVRNPSFATPDFVALARKYNAAICYAHHHDYPEFADITSDFVYARLQKGEDFESHRLCTPGRSRRIGRRAKTLGRGRPARRPALCRPGRSTAPQKKPRDVFAYIIHEGKAARPATARWR
jgi:hypothetical protein